MQLENLRNLFPKTGRNYALTGYIPIEYFDENEKEIRSILKKRGGKHRVWYRGPRYKFAATTTLRSNATHAVIYPS